MPAEPASEIARLRVGGNGPRPALAAIGLALLLLATIAAAALLAGAFIAGLGLPMIGAFFATAAVGGTTFGLVRLARLRRPILAALLGGLAGLIAHLGQFHLWAAWTFGPEFLPRLDLLPEVIRLRMASDTITATPGPIDDDASPTPGLNWVFFSLDLAILTIGSGAAGFVAARRAWCERCGRWASSTTMSLPAEAADAVRAALAGDPPMADLAKLARYAVSPHMAQSAGLRLTLDRCETVDCVRPAELRMKVPLFASGAKEEAGLRRDLTHEEARQLAPLFGDAPDAQPTPAASNDAGVATVERLEGATVGRVTKGWGAAVVGAADILPMLLGLAGSFGGLGLMVLISGRADEGRAATWEWVAGGMFLVIAVLWAIASVVIQLWWPNSFGNRTLGRRLRESIERRPDAIVLPSDPLARVAEIVPLESVGRLTQKTEDVGLVVVDSARRELRFEGDTSRRRVPAEAIVGAEHATYTEASSQFTTTTHHFCVLTVRTPDGERRWPFRLREPWRRDAPRAAFALRLADELSALADYSGGP